MNDQSERPRSAKRTAWNVTEEKEDLVESGRYIELYDSTKTEIMTQNSANVSYCTDIQT